MKKNIFLLSIAVFMLFISACGADDEDGIFAGSECSFEGAEICSDNGVDILVCQSSTWTVKKQCNISIGKKCRQGSDGTLGCFGDGESTGNHGNNDPENSDYTDNENTDPDASASDSDTISDTDQDYSDTETEYTDNDNSSSEISDDIENDSDDSDSKPQTDSDPDNTPDDYETPDNDSGDTGNLPDNDIDSDSGDTGNVPDNDTDSDSGDTGTTEGQCMSNSDCSGSTPYCSIATSQCIENAVFITEYVEGESNNRAIEIYNGSKSPINLSNYTLKQANAGSNAESRKDWGKDDSGNISTSFTYTFPLIQLDPDETYTVCNKESVSDLLEKCDDKPATGSTFSFTGNDGLALFEGNTILDQIGTNKTTPTEPWDVAGKEKATEDHTLRRKPEIIQGTTDWAASAGTTEENSEWIVLPKNTFNGLGSR